MADVGATRWRAVDQLFHDAMAESPGARVQFIEAQSGGDAALAQEVLSLVALHTAAETFLEQPARESAGNRPADAIPGALAGCQIGGYSVKSLLGVGGMGEVYLAHDMRLGRDVALKILRRGLAADPGYLRRFEDEARSASVLNHQNIVTIYGVGDENGIGYIAMERVEGLTLREMIASGPLPLPTVLNLAVQLAEALTVAHASGIVHRDLKPDNVMVTREGLAKVLDFGIAKRQHSIESPRSAFAAIEGPGTQAGMILGTVGYMSPEQAAGQPAVPASDQFSLGAMLYEMLTGRRAFERSTAVATLDAILKDEPGAIRAAVPDAPAALQQVITRCLAKQPAERYALTRDLAAELRRVRDERQRAIASALNRRRTIRRGAIAAVLLGAATFGVWQTWFRDPPVRSLAVLPFTNAGQAGATDYLGDGLTEALIQRLFGLPRLSVTPRSTVFSLSQQGLSPRDAGARLGVDTVLSGSTKSAGGQLGIFVELIDVKTGATLWRHTYDRPAADLVDIQDEIATGVVDEGLRLRVDTNVRRRLLERPTRDAEAYDLYMRGRHVQLQTSAEDYIDARALFSRALSRDPKFAQAWVGLAGTHWTMVIDGQESPTEGWPEVDRAIDRALLIDPDLPSAHAGLALVKFAFDWNWSAAEREWGIALNNATRDVEPETLFGYALEQWATGQTDRALTLIQKARQLNPFSPEIKSMEADYRARLGQLDAAASLYEEAIRDMPDPRLPSAGLMDVRRQQGRFDDCIAIWRGAHGAEGAAPALANARGESGYRAIQHFEAERELRELQRQEQHTYVSRFLFARAYARLGQTEDAFKYLDQAYFDEHAAPLVFLNVDRSFERIRNDKRFTALLDKLNLTERKQEKQP